MTIAALPVKAAKTAVAVGALGHMAGERRLADAGVAEQAKDLGLARFQPAPDLVDGGGLLAVHSRPPARGGDGRDAAGAAEDRRALGAAVVSGVRRFGLGGGAAA